MIGERLYFGSEIFASRRSIISVISVILAVILSRMLPSNTFEVEINVGGLSLVFMHGSDIQLHHISWSNEFDQSI